ncbi:MAG TPA: AMP-binding protein, partial [Cellvibrionaceae bacterium]|nr:AMP-binding protein [Cellvibrionaceae bacterium]
MNLTACCAKTSTPTPMYLSTLQRAFFMGRRKDFDLHVHTHLYVEHEFSELDINRLYRAVEILVARHPMLRAWVAPDTQVWVQQVVPVVPDVQDYSAMNGDALNLALEGRRDSLYRVDGDVELVPNIQVAVTQIASGYRVHINLDLLLLDGSSIRIVLHELSAIYDDINGHWPEKPLDFAHVAEQMAQLKASSRYQTMLKFWFERLETLPPGPQLPLRAQTEAIRRSRLIRRKLIIGPERWAMLATKANKQNISATALIFSVFTWVLAYWSKQGHFSVTMLMYQIRNQNMGDLSEAVANFAGTLLMEVERKAGQSFLDFCKSIHAEIFRNATKSLVCGMEVLQERNRQDKSTFRAASPVAFVSMINELGNPVQPGRFQMEGDYAIAGGLETPQVLMDHQAISRPDGGVSLNWDTMDSAFEPGVIDAMFAAYSRLIDALLSDASSAGQSSSIWEKTYTDLRPEAQQIKHQVYNLSQDLVPQQHLHSLFFQQAAQTPAAPYLRFLTDPADPNSLQTLSYGAVRLLANRLARQLQYSQLAPGELVAVYCSKGWQQVVAAIGILAAGGAYVPLDPRQPLARKQDILNRCDCRLAVTQGAWLTDAALAGLTLFDLEALPEDDLAVSMKDLPARQKLSDTAYVIFTSGSTGTPKGVTLDHTGPVNSILDINRRINLTPADCLCGLSELNFDLSVYDIFGAAAAGASLLIPPEGAGRDPALCGQLVQAAQVTVWNSVPALAQLFADYHTSRHSWPLRLFMLSGDWIPIGLPQQLQQLRELEVLSLGGATEASIWSIYYPVRHTRSDWKSIP